MTIPVYSYTIYHSPNAYLGTVLLRRAIAGLPGVELLRPLCGRNRAEAAGVMLTAFREPSRAASPCGRGLSEEHDEPSDTDFDGIVAVRVSQPDRAGKGGRACEPHTDLELS
jgi:hypothetical protein